MLEKRIERTILGKPCPVTEEGHIIRDWNPDNNYLEGYVHLGHARTAEVVRLGPEYSDNAVPANGYSHRKAVNE
jgi:hypothetical protein